MTGNTSAEELKNQIHLILIDCDRGGMWQESATGEIVQLITSYTNQRELEARLDEHNHIKWQPNEYKYLSDQATRLSAIQKERGNL